MPENSTSSPRSAHVDHSRYRRPSPEQIAALVASRWRELEPWLRLYHSSLRSEGLAPADLSAAEWMARMRDHHSHVCTSLLSAGLDVRYVRRARLDNPLMTEEARVCAVNAHMRELHFGKEL